MILYYHINYKECHCDFEQLVPVIHKKGKYCIIPNTYKIKLGEILSYLEEFKDYPITQVMPEIPERSFKKKLFSTYLSYLPEKEIMIPCKMNSDYRGSFTELLKTDNHGQISVNTIKPKLTKGNHYHNSKWELFIVVAGHGIIKQRKIGTERIIMHEVSGDKIEVITILPGYTHSITNLSDTENLVTLMWANEIFNPDHPDTFAEEV